MSTEVRLRRGTTAQHAAFTGAVGEVTVDTTKNVVVVHDGVTPGGIAAEPSSYLRARANHTGTQATSTIAGFDASVRSLTQAQLVAGPNVSITPTGPNLVVSTLATPSPIVSIKDFGAVGNGIADDTAAKNAAEAANASVYWPEGTYKLTTPPTLGKSWGVGNVMIGSVKQYLHPSPGPVEEIVAAVWNPPTTLGTDAAPALQAAINFAQLNNLPVAFQRGALYQLNSTLTFQHGRTGAETFVYHVLVRGNDASFVPASPIYAMTVAPRATKAEEGSGKEVAEIRIADVRFHGMLSATSGSIKIGTAGKSCHGLSWGQITNVIMQAQSIPTAIYIVEARKLRFTNVNLRSGGLTAAADTTNSFVGDLIFHACEFSGRVAGSPCVSILAAVEGGSSNAQARGIHFTDCFFYGTPTTLYAGGSSSLAGDLFFIGCQWDAGLSAQTAITISTGGTAQINGVHIVNPYVVAWARVIDVTAGTIGKITDINISGGQFGMITGAIAAWFMRVSGLTFRGNRFKACTNATCTINCDVVTDTVITDNVSITTTTPYAVIIGNASTNYSICGNVMQAATGLVNDYSSGTPVRQVLNNLKT